MSYSEVDEAESAVKMNRCTLFKNKRKRNEGDPTCTGKICVNGTWFWIKGWTNQYSIDGEVEKVLGLSLVEMTDEQVQKYGH